ncbi:MAG: response regulator [candidate division WOR-3 bacterium]|nr:MAG: response regulator [candidate division WOR-3 bacterium]
MNEKRILLFADQLETQDSLRSMLTSLGHHVTVCADHTSAFGHVQNDNPDVVICDMELSGQDSLQTLRIVRGNAGFAGPLVAMSNRTGEDDRKAATAAGASKLLLKPVSLEDLVSIVGRADAAPTEAPAALKGSHVMVVEDEPATLRMFKDALQKAGYRVTGVEVGVSAFDTFEDDLPAVIVADLHTLGLDGVELITTLREEYGYKGPIIAVSASGEPGDRSAALKAGADEFLAKPVDIDRLLESVHYRIDQAQA